MAGRLNSITLPNYLGMTDAEIQASINRNLANAAYAHSIQTEGV